MTRAAVMGVLILLGIIPTTTSAEPMRSAYVEDNRCDFIKQDPLSHELIDGILINREPIGVVSLETTQTTCVNNTTVDDFRVDITNNTGIAWVDLFFVADEGVTIGNSDGEINGQDAFSIDSVGLNMPLIREFGGGAGAQPGVFDPGETWRFLVTDFDAGRPGGGPAPMLATIGVPSPGIVRGSNASIVAEPKNEPVENGAAGPGVGGNNNPVLSFDAATGILSFSDSAVNVLNLSGSFSGIDPIFATDPILDATISVDDFHFIRPSDNGFLFAGGSLEIADGTDVFLSADIPLLLVDDSMLAVFGNNIVGNLENIFVDLSLGSDFLESFNDAVFDPKTLATEIFGLTAIDIVPLIENNIDFSTEVAILNAHSIPDSSTLSLFAAGAISFLVFGWRRQRRQSVLDGRIRPPVIATGGPLPN